MLKKRTKRKPVTSRVTQKEYPKITLQQALDIVLSAKRSEGLRERTLKDYEKDWGYFVKWLNQEYPDIETIDEITTDTVRNYINYLKYDAQRYSGHKNINYKKQKIGLSDTTVNIRLRVYKALFNHLDREGLIEFNPMDNIKLLKQDLNADETFTDEEVKEILRQPNQRDYVGFRDYVALLILIDCGLRAKSLLNLRITDFDFKTRFITVPSEHSKNRKPIFVPFSSHTGRLVMQLHTENQAHFKTDRLFLSSYGEPLGQNHFNKRLKYYAEKAGLDPTKRRCTAHAYRHYWATKLVKSGIDIYTLQKMGAWSDIRTLKKYVNLDNDHMRESHDEHSPVNEIVNKRKGITKRL